MISKKRRPDTLCEKQFDVLTMQSQVRRNWILPVLLNINSTFFPLDTPQPDLTGINPAISQSIQPNTSQIAW